MLSEEDDDMKKEIISEYKNIKEETDRFKIETYYLESMIEIM